MTIFASRKGNCSSSTVFFLFFICISQITKAEDKPQHGRKVVCYYASWSTYRTPYPFTPKEIDPSLCTHIVYNFAALKNDTQDAIESYGTYTDLKKDYGLGYYFEVTSLKKKYPHLKVLLCIGGWNQGSINFSKLAQEKAKRDRFISSVVAYLREHKFDGLDIFWQYPGERGGSPNDKQNFVKLLKELKNELEKHNFLLTVTLSNNKFKIEIGYDLPSIEQTVDWVNLYCLNFNSPWNKKFGAISPLDSSDDNNVKNILTYYLDNGISSSKLVAIFPTFGFGFTNTHEAGNAGALKGLYDEDIGFHTYHEICRYVIDPKSGWTETWDNVTSTPIAVKGNEKISYDNQNSIKLKVKYAYEKKLAGVGVWTLDSDDFLGLCSLPGYGSEGNRSKFPLVKAINQEYDRLIKEERLKNPDNLPHKNDIKVSISIHEY